MKRLFFVLISIIFISGCATLKETTLPASFKDSYSFSTYELFPSNDPQWRFVAKNTDTQSVSFVNAENYSRIFSWITPVFSELSEVKREKDIIDYFQNKKLKELELSPDIILSEKSIKKSQKRIGNMDYKILSIGYTIEKDSFKNVFYYSTPVNDLMYTFSLLENKKRLKNDIEENKLIGDLENIIQNIKLKKPKKEDVIELRVNYAYSNFLESATDRYLKEKITEVQERYNVAIKEVKSWLKLLPDNYWAYNMLGVLCSYNDKFELYGEGFDYENALENLKKSVEIRNYFKIAHYNLADLYKNTKQINKAIEEYEALIKISPNDENIYYALGTIYEKDLDDKITARQYYEKAIRYWGLGFATLEELKNKLKYWEKDTKKSQ